MTNEQVILSFFKGVDASTSLRTINVKDNDHCYKYKTRTLYTRSTIDIKTNNVNYIELINYDTRIAYITDNILYLNIGNYSATTRQIQSKIISLAKRKGLPIQIYKGDLFQIPHFIEKKVIDQIKQIDIATEQTTNKLDKVENYFTMFCLYKAMDKTDKAKQVFSKLTDLIKQNENNKTFCNKCYEIIAKNNFCIEL